MRDEYIREAQKVIQDPNILINVVSRRVKQLRRGSRPLVVSLEKLAPEDVALREIIEGKITYRLPTTEELAIAKGKVTRVRAGPFASRDAAEKAAEKLKGLGLKPGDVAAKS